MKILNVLSVAAIIFSGATWAADDKVAAADAPVAKTAQDTPIGTPAQVFGKIVSLHKCELVGMKEPHIIVKLESAPGDVEVVDLGSAAELKTNGIEPREGQFLSVEGKVGSINGKPLVVAESLSESKMIYVTRQGSLKEESTQKHAEGHEADKGSAPRVARDPSAAKTLTSDGDTQVRVIEGTVINTRRVKIENDSNEHILAKVQTDNGIVVLDLGVCSGMPANVDLTEGKLIAASGYVGHLNGKSIIIADSVGNLSSIQRPNEPAVVPTAAPTPAK